MLLLVGVKPGYYTGSLLNLFSKLKPKRFHTHRDTTGDAIGVLNKRRR